MALTVETSQQRAPDAGLKVEPLTPTIGAEIAGVDMRTPLSTAVRDAIWDEFLRHKVVFTRDQRMTTAEFLAFARQFGVVQPDQIGSTIEGFPEVLRLLRNESERGIENRWHCDGTTRPDPPVATILRAIVVPPIGGDTLFCDMAAAYDGLPDDVKRRIEGLEAVHDFARVYFPEASRASTRRRVDLVRRLSAATSAPDDENAPLMAKIPPVAHPIVRIHPETGRRSLFITQQTTVCIAGIPEDESKELLEYLYAQATTPEYQCRFRWSDGAIAMWDERTVQHYAVSDYFPQTRHMERIRLIGGGPVVGPPAV